MKSNFEKENSIKFSIIFGWHKKYEKSYTQKLGSRHKNSYRRTLEWILYCMQRHTDKSNAHAISCRRRRQSKSKNVNEDISSERWLQNGPFHPFLRQKIFIFINTAIIIYQISKHIQTYFMDENRVRMF